jgi:hypothetical protein
LGRAVLIGRFRGKVICEGDTMADKDFFFYANPFADKTVTGYFAALAYLRSFLDFDEGTDLRVVSNRASVEVRKGVNFDASS